MAIDRVGVEGSAFLGRPLVPALTRPAMTSARSRPTAPPIDANRRRRAKTAIEDAEVIARETFADPQLPPAGGQRTRNPAWNTLQTTRDWVKIACVATSPAADRG